MATYHLTLDSQGYLIDLQSYKKGVASPFAPKNRQGDPGYGDLTRASVWAQTSWRGGIGNATFDPTHPDRFYQGASVDVSQGDLRLGRDLTKVYDPGSGTTTDIYAFCAYLGVLYAISANNGKVFSSSDGTTWSVVHDTTKASLRSICLFNGWLMIGGGANGEITKFDGTTWTDTWATVASSSGIHSLQAWAPNGTEYLFAGVGLSSSLSTLTRLTTAAVQSTIYTTQLPNIDAMILWGPNLIFSALSETAGYRGEVYSYDGAAINHVCTIPDNGITAFAHYRDPQGPMAPSPAPSAPGSGGKVVSDKSPVLQPSQPAGDVAYSLYRGPLLAGSRTGGVIWVVGATGLTELFRFPGIIGIGGTFAYTMPIRGMLMEAGRLWVCVLDTNGLGLYMYDGRGWSNPSSGVLQQEPRGIASFNSQLLISGKSTNGARIYKTASTVPTTANITTAAFDAGLVATDKLFLSVTLQHAALTANQSIAVAYDIDDTGSYTALGTSSTVGATSATYTFAAASKGKRIRFQITLTVVTTSATPQLQALLMNYIVATDSKAEWTFDVLLEGTTEEPLQLLDNTASTSTGAQLADALWTSKAKKSTLAYVDIDGESKTVYLVDVEETVSKRSDRLGLSTRAKVKLEEV